MSIADLRILFWLPAFLIQNILGGRRGRLKIQQMNRPTRVPQISIITSFDEAVLDGINDW
jgi:hypothetical protein